MTYITDFMASIDKLEREKRKQELIAKWFKRIKELSRWTSNP